MRKPSARTPRRGLHPSADGARCAAFYDVHLLQRVRFGRQERQGKGKKHG